MPAAGEERTVRWPQLRGLAALIVAPSGTILEWTEAAQDLLGYPAKEILGRNAATLLVEPLGKAGTHVGGGSRTFEGQALLRHSAGTSVRIRYTVSPLDSSGDGGRPARYLALFGPASQSSAGERAELAMALLQAAAADIGSSLDVTRTAQDLARVLVPAFGDVSTVDLAGDVLIGEEPPMDLLGRRLRMRRIAGAHLVDRWPEDLLPPGELLPPLPLTPAIRSLLAGHAVLLPNRTELEALRRRDPALVQLLMPRGMSSGVAAPLYARGTLLGVVGVWRSTAFAPFDADDEALLQEIASRGALGVDNARRYTREHRAAVALQRSLLPHEVSATTAAESAGTYLPTGARAGVGGDWFDVIPLPSLRVAFVVGDVVGHGLHATATMGRLRTAVSTLADMDLEPGELLTRLDDLAIRLAEERTSDVDDTHVLGATCLYAVYDPVTRRCTLASAGHPPPAVVHPGDGTAQFIDVPPGPPLGIGGLPFEETEISLEPGSVLAFYTDGLVGDDRHDIARGMERLLSSLRADPSRTLERTAADVLADLPAHDRLDDVALLLARTRAVRDEDIATWELPAEPAVVAHARDLVLDQLAAWKLGELAFSTELIVSELVTNAIRYAGGPVTVRLILDEVLVCEVSDPSSTQPRMRRAHVSDEGGRGLFLVAQLAHRWGSRYTKSGKTIWTHQRLTSP